jgi:hypothetical protein
MQQIQVRGYISADLFTHTGVGYFNRGKGVFRGDIVEGGQTAGVPIASGGQIAKKSPVTGRLLSRRRSPSAAVLRGTTVGQSLT